MRTNLTVIKVGEPELLSGGATKLMFQAMNGDGKAKDCFTFKPTVQAEVKEGAELDVEVDELKYTSPAGPITVYKVTWNYNESIETPKQPAQGGTWAIEKAAEVIGQLLVGKVITDKSKLAKKLYKWLDDTMPG